MTRPAWTSEQQEAILSLDDTLLSANAGTGKTTTVVGKIQWLLGLDVGLEPPSDPCRLDEIAAITFTEKAAHDLKAKLRGAIAESDRADELRWEIDRASIGTIHSFCASLLREHALRLGIDPSFSVLDEREARSAMDDLIREIVLERLDAGDEGLAAVFNECTLNGYEHTRGTIDLVRDVLRDVRWHEERYRRWCDDDGLDSESLRSLASDGPDPNDDVVLRHCDALYRTAQMAFARWKQHMADENARDYDSLILDTRDLLTGPRADAALASIRRRYRILIIDEFQDTDHAQKDIAFAIGRGLERPQLFFVGDPKQSIYRFRGADIAVWNEVEQSLRRDGHVLSLRRNFRSQPELIDYLNDVGACAIEQTGTALAAELPGSRIGYTELEPALDATGTAAVEWLEVEDSGADERRIGEGEQVARRIRELVEGGVEIVDPRTGEPRPCQYRDIAILYRTRTGVELYQQALARHGVPAYSSGLGGLSEQQEIRDLLNALQLIENPADDLAAFSFLRSPFIGLRDEVLAWMGLERRQRTLLYQAREMVDVEWWDSGDHPRLTEIERASLRSGVKLIDELRRLAARLPLDALVQELLDRTGYRLHLMIMGENREALANLQTFIRVAEQHRKRSLGTFLDIWKCWDEQDSGLPQAPLYSAEDDVVTMSTIHRAKGLEWPLVFLIDSCSTIDTKTWHRYWTDPDFGPILGPKKDQWGPRSQRLIERLELEEMAEEARLLYVASTRARDRLIVTGPRGSGKSWVSWLEAGLDRPVVSDRTSAGDLPHPPRPPRATLEWLDRVVEGEGEPLARPAPAVPLRFLTSATEAMMRENDPRQWELRYLHGVEPPWTFARDRSGGGVPAHLRGTVIHGVLERIQEQEELARLLDEVVGELDAPELEPVLMRGTAYRQALEEEIARVVSSDEWKWYTEADHFRELEFLHLVDSRSARVGAFDLFRIGEPNHIIDFKTHEIGAAQIEKTAASYRRQMELYSEAAGLVGPVEVRLHFTSPGVAVEM